MSSGPPERTAGLTNRQTDGRDEEQEGEAEGGREVRTYM